MGAVWLGTDEVLGRSVAVKRVGMLPGVTNPDMKRAEREARIAAQLNHPHVVAVFDLVEDGEAQWLVMEYVEGTNLSELVKANGSLPPDQAAPILTQAAEALAAAHSSGIVHRDVKPSNLLVTPDGQVKLTDFGIARAEADASLTQTGLVTGSPAYLAPEVAMGQTATESSDVWSFGATLFHALSGRPPYDIGDNLVGGLYKIVHEEPPRLADAGWLAPMLENTMERDPERRWSMTQVLNHFASGGADPQPTQTVPVVDPPTVIAALPPDGRHQAPPSTQEDLPVLAPTPAEPRRRQQPSRTIPLVAAAIGVAAVLLVGLAIGLGNREDPADPQTDSSSSETASDSTDGSDEGPTAAGMEDFVEDYLTTAASDRRAAYEMLTPSFQEASGNYGGYSSFWSQVRGIEEISSVTADPETLQVTYTYTYELNGGGSQEETVSLTLEYDDGTYRIASEA